MDKNMSNFERPLWWATVLVVILSLTRCSATADCGGNLTEKAGVIFSPNFPNGYPPNQQCHWTITVEKNQVITLRFQHLDLERHNAFICIDYLQVYNGPSTQSPVLGRPVCGSETETVVTDIRFWSSGHQMHLYFHSDSNGTRPGFNATYVAHECPPFTYGSDECDQPCSCDQENSVYCLSHNGTCVCKDGWTSSNCTTDINECENPNACTDLYSECHNLLGSYECKCRPGMSKNTFGVCEDTQQCTVKNCSHACGVLSTNPYVQECYCPRGMELEPVNSTCIACSDWKFGMDCAHTCTCFQRNTQTCDKINGLCTCYPNWTSTDCFHDTNECLTKSSCINSVCENYWGDFGCRCFHGYEQVTNKTTCEECGRVITQPEGTFFTPDFNPSRNLSGHPPFQDCNWTIEADEGNVVSFSFKMFLLQRRATHPAYVEVYDGRNSSFKMIGNYSGDVYNNRFLPGMIRSSGNELFIALYSSLNYSRNGVTYQWTRGFSAKYWTHACPVDTFGEESCNNTCKCVKDKTQFCNNINGQCVCKHGWRGYNCSEDINECLGVNFCPPGSKCRNSPGSYTCSCTPGYIYNSTSSSCEIHVVPVSMIFVIDMSSLELEDRNSDDYKRIKNQLEQMIETQLKKTEVPVVSVNVSDLTALGNGRLKFDCAVALTMDKGENPDKTVTLPLLSFFTDEKVAVDGKSASVDILKVGDQQYAASDSPCVMKQKSDPCSDECEEKEGVAVCKSESEKEKDDLLVKLGLGLGIPAFCLLCVVIGTIVYCCIKKRKEKIHLTGMGSFSYTKHLEIRQADGVAKPMGNNSRTG